MPPPHEHRPPSLQGKQHPTHRFPVKCLYPFSSFPPKARHAFDARNPCREFPHLGENTDYHVHYRLVSLSNMNGTSNAFKSDQKIRKPFLCVVTLSLVNPFSLTTGTETSSCPSLKFQQLSECKSEELNWVEPLKLLIERLSGPQYWYFRDGSGFFLFLFLLDLLTTFLAFLDFFQCWESHAS